MDNHPLQDHHFTNREYADMYLIYGETRRVSARGVVSLYAERYPNRRRPNHQVILRLDSAYREGRIPGIQNAAVRPRTIDNDIVLEEVEQDPSTSVRLIERRTGIPKSSVQRILNRHLYHPYHIQKVQTLIPSDYIKRVIFCRRMLQKNEEDPNFFDKVLWSDESSCRRDGYANLHNIHSWQLANPHETREDKSQHQFKINLWTGIFQGTILGPVELPPTLNGENY